jgi:hypothetical protein
MASPYPPSAFAACVPTTEDGLWTIIVKFYKQGFYWYAWKLYAFTSDGVLTEEYKTDLCKAKCKALSSMETPVTYNNCQCVDVEGKPV